MSIKLGIMALLTADPMYGYQLRQEFESRTGGTWPLNIGQVYTTIGRLVRDGLIEPVAQGDTGSEGEAEGGGAETERYRLTLQGRESVEEWWSTPVLRSTPARDELTIKLALAVTVPGVDVAHIVQVQRSETMNSLHDYTQLKIQTDRALREGGPVPDGSHDLAWSLLLDNLIFTAEAEVRWLDHVEGRLANAARSRVERADSTAPEPSSGKKPGKSAISAKKTRSAR